jgi:ribosomal protein S18 acetylase RimI-like enzyme
MSEQKEAEELLLYSESFPPNEKNERKKMKPIAECHKLLKGIKIDPSQIVYKPLTPENVEEVKKLHIEWFPVKYEDDFFVETLINNKGNYFTVAAFYNIQTGENEYKEVILGLVICQWLYVESHFFTMTNEDIRKEISDNINWEEEAKFFLSKNKFYHCAYIMSLGVIDECRKMNIGTSMLRAIYNYIIVFDFVVGIYLNVISSNTSGKKFYEKNGLKYVNHIKDFYVIDDKNYDCDVYVRIFNKKEKSLRDNYFLSMMTIGQKILYYCLYKPFYFIVYVFILVFLLRCFRKKIKTE